MGDRGGHPLLHAIRRHEPEEGRGERGGSEEGRVERGVGVGREGE